MTAQIVATAVSFPPVAFLRVQSDERLAALAREGSELAFATLVERHRRAVLRTCRCVLSEDRAEDSAQQTFVCAWEALRRGDDVRDVRAWLLRIARNTALNALRVRGYDYHELRDSMRLSEAPEDELERREVMRRALVGLAALPERQREALLLSAVDGAPHAAIARELGLSEGAARQLVRRARNTLRLAVGAVAPLPLVRWVANHPAQGEHVRSLSQLVGESSTVGAGAIIAKAGAAALVAGGLITTPAVVPRVTDEARGASPPAASIQIGVFTARALPTVNAIRTDAHRVTRDNTVQRQPGQRPPATPAAPADDKRDTLAQTNRRDDERRPMEHPDVEQPSLPLGGSETVEEGTFDAEALRADSAAYRDDVAGDTSEAPASEPGVESANPDDAATEQEHPVPDETAEDAADNGDIEIVA